MAELFGFNITRVKAQTDLKNNNSVNIQAEDGTQVVGGGFFSYDMEGTGKTEQDLIRRYREIILHQSVIWRLKILSMRQLLLMKISNL